MAKDENNRLLSKVAKFVRNPLKDWSELDQDGSPSPEGGYSREMLKEMIERRQRNDFVRKREFEMLRKLRQREAAGGREGTPSSLDISSTPGKTEGRALTLKKIDEIEEQMSQQWWRNRPQRPADDGEPDPDGALRASGMAAQHARAYADTVPGMNPNGAPQSEVGSQRPPLDGSIEEAAIRFAHRDDAGAESILLQAVAPDNPGGEDDEIWRTLFDFYRAVDDAEKFTAASLRYAQRTHRISPSFMSLPAIAVQMQPAGGLPRSALAGGDFWVSPARLAREGLVDLTRALSAAGPVWKLDWHAIEAIEPDAAGPLRALFVHWADSPVQLRFSSADRLLLVLAEATPVNDRSVDAVWWQLHMAALRMMHRDDEFELLALNYCITYEVSPPPWEPPQGQYAEVDVLSTTLVATGVGPSFSSSSMVATESLPPVRLAGELQGESLATWQRLESDLARHPMAPISCAGLLRLDFAAAGTLLNWVMARDASGQRVRFVDAHRLVAAFFTVIGITNHADILVRSD